GLAGCEAAYILAKNGIDVDLYEMKPSKYSPAHHYSGFAELVCSNSFKASRIGSAAGLLKHEIKSLGSLLIECAEKTAVAAGGALAVDRERFSNMATEKIRAMPNIQIIEKEVTNIPDGLCIIATGPLTTDIFAAQIQKICGDDYLSFFDAAAPIIAFDSIDMEKVFFAARYGRGDDDYINCPFEKQSYEAFYEALITAESAELKEFEKETFKVYEGCMPVEVMAKRGIDTLRYGPLKPVGLTDPITNKRPWAVVQLRQENIEKTLFNLVGFQTNLKFAEQKRVFSMIPGLEQAEFIRYGVMHRNTFINSPKLLDCTFSLKKNDSISFAGQITGVEGYMESASSGLLAGLHMLRKIQGKPKLTLPKDTMIGALSHYISDEFISNFQPMGANMGILPPMDVVIKDKQKRYEAISERAVCSLNQFISDKI
ncbi:MAG: methylenetetrahydrofolate--tRNA-(uracil(54)-C(5))-methyltransferase (FADH(2)-oxidizing) TrmFO, partial [Oscillospiraceae bacterium]